MALQLADTLNPLISLVTKLLRAATELKKVLTFATKLVILVL